MNGLFPVSIDEQIAEVERELKMRGFVYRQRVAAGKLSQKKADEQIAAMEAALETLKKVRDGK